ncbi:MAG: CMP-N-acetylneuraminic acid synthetase [Parcubacteria group bacterium CG10_big_fil_rev_8_21_14_0_10_36_14]|nr:MAG: CMP-N-acetylneuraminic acid synthetase [Parcubacteria group bacterium CG10_big_fil_rev_8_21_14_0_10_36_14]
MKDIKFGNIIIGKTTPVVVIAEIACEHMGNMENAKELIRMAKNVGADIAKFQLHIPEIEMVPNVINFWAGSLDKILAKVNIGEKEQHKELMKYCNEIGIQYLCTPFCIEASDILDEIGVKAFKTGSGEMTNLTMIRHIAKKRKPMIVSTGMCTMDEIRETVAVLKEEGVDFVLTNCTSEYPANYEHLNLNLINILEKEFGILIGHSDHTKEIYSSIAAVALGARVIEKHFTIRDLHGPDDLVSLDPEEFKELVSAIRKVEKTLFSEKNITKEEQDVRDWAHHSVIAKDDIGAGEVVGAHNLRAARPGTGIPAKFLDKIFSEGLFGRKTKHDIAKNAILQWNDLE